MPDDDLPRRRHDDCVTFRDMVEYVAESDARYHAARAETLVQISNAMERHYEAMTKALDEVRTLIGSHLDWHRDVLQGYLERATSNTTAIVACVISTLAVIATIVSAVMLR